MGDVCKCRSEVGWREVGGTTGEASSRASGSNQNDFLQSRSFRDVLWLRMLCGGGCGVVKGKMNLGFSLRMLALGEVRSAGREVGGTTGEASSRASGDDQPSKLELSSCWDMEKWKDEPE